MQSVHALLCWVSASEWFRQNAQQRDFIESILVEINIFEPIAPNPFRPESMGKFMRGT